MLHTLPRDPPSQNTGDLDKATLVIPRLISVVEIIKREYIKHLHDTHSQRFVGLHQYNQLGTLEDLGYGETAGHDPAELIDLALQGKKYAIALWSTLSCRLLVLQHQPQTNAIFTNHIVFAQNTRTQSIRNVCPVSYELMAMP